MHELQNVLYVQTQGAMLNLDHDAVRVRVEDQADRRIPLIRLASITVFGQVSVSPFLIHRCAEDGRGLVWLSRAGRFQARVEGPVRGNVLLRRAQHLALSDPRLTADVARAIVAAKIQNARQILLRAAREGGPAEPLVAAVARLAIILQRLPGLDDLNTIRGSEGEAARAYIDAFTLMVRGVTAFIPTGRTRRPSLDRMNSLLSFLYALLRSECVAALEGVGLDPQVGFLHALRPGRPALALDLMEEFRPAVADRLALTLVNRHQIAPEDFEVSPGGAVSLTEDGRKLVLTAYQKRKEEEVLHRILKQRVPLGLLPHVQARLLARYLRGNLEDYPPYLLR